MNASEENQGASTNTPSRQVRGTRVRFPGVNLNRCFDYFILFCLTLSSNFKLPFTVYITRGSNGDKGNCPSNVIFLAEILGFTIYCLGLCRKEI